MHATQAPSWQTEPSSQLLPFAFSRRVSEHAATPVAEQITIPSWHGFGAMHDAPSTQVPAGPSRVIAIESRPPPSTAPLPPLADEASGCKFLNGVHAEHRAATINAAVCHANLIASSRLPPPKRTRTSRILGTDAREVCPRERGRDRPKAVLVNGSCWPGQKKPGCP